MTFIPQGRPGVNGYKGEKGESGGGAGYSYPVSFLSKLMVSVGYGYCKPYWFTVNHTGMVTVNTPVRSGV